MLLDLRVVLVASLATVLLLIAGFGLIAGFRTSIKPSIGFTVGGPPLAQATQPPVNLQPAARSKEIISSITDVPAVNSGLVQTPSPAPNLKKDVNIAPQKRSALTDADKAVAPDPIGAVIKADQANQNVKAKKKVVRRAPPPTQSRPSNSFSIFGNQNN
jgi:hypothetical protein